MKVESKPIERIQHGWSCMNPKHFHLHKEVAERCAEKHLNRAPTPRRWSSEMYADVFIRRQSGQTFKVIGAAYGIGIQRAREVYVKGMRKKWMAENPNGDYWAYLQAANTASSSPL